jgi:DNA-binding response OmpR family regulator
MGNAELGFLIVDDDEDQRLSLFKIIRKFFPGASVLEAYDGESALRLFYQGGTKIVITDGAMHPMNGIKLIARIRQSDKSVPIILVTGDSTFAAQGSEVGASIILKKPYEIQTLIQTIKNLLVKSM